MLPASIRIALLPLASGALIAQARWTRSYPPTSPSVRQDAAMATFEDTGDVFLYGGIDPVQQQAVTDTWRWNGSSWTLVPFPLNPGNQIARPMAWDPAGRRIVLYEGGVAPRFATWLLDATGRWVSVNHNAGPASRRDHVLATDPVNRRVVLFGGNDGNGNLLDTTWEWTSRWAQVPTGSGPSARGYAAMTFDPSTQRLLLFGGSSQTTVLDDTWTLDGASWQRHLPATPPWPRGTHSLATDTARRRVVLFGGEFVDPNTWEWDGAEWTPLGVIGPMPRVGARLAYDPIRREVLLHGGRTQFGYLNDTWSFATPSPAGFTVYGQGCANGASAPQLTNAPFSLPWLGDTFRTRLRVFHPAAAGAVFVTGLQRTTPQSLGWLGLPAGCDSLVTLDSFRFVPIGGGIAEWSLFVPMAPALVGVSIRQQGVVLDPSVPGGAAVSNGGETLTGWR